MTNASDTRKITTTLWGATRLKSMLWDLEPNGDGTYSTR
jgi:hypothetical protein